MPADLPAASERLRQRAAAELEARLPTHLGRLGWDRVRLADSVFWYGGAVHPITFYPVLEGVQAITEFQVRQRRRGVIIDVVADGDLDKPALRDAVRRGLARCGLAWPEVAVRTVTSIERHAETGKVLRFLPSASNPPFPAVCE